MKWLSGVLALCALLCFPMTGCAKQPQHDDDVADGAIDTGGTADVLHDADVSVDAIQFSAADALTSTDVSSIGHVDVAAVGKKLTDGKKAEVAHGRADVVAWLASDRGTVGILPSRKTLLQPLPSKLPGVAARATDHASWRKFGRFAGADC